MIAVYGAPRSRAFRVIWMLEELDLPYELIPTTPAQARQSPLLELNPSGSLPTGARTIGVRRRHRRPASLLKPFSAATLYASASVGWLNTASRHTSMVPPLAMTACPM